MSTTRRLARGSLFLALLFGAAACGAQPKSPPEPPAQLQAVDGSEVKKVTLTETAQAAVGVQTGTVAAGATEGALTIPYAGVLYYLDGSTWTYTETAPRTYLRVPITVTSIQGDAANLSEGPPVGTKVVTIGSTELLGAELEIDGER